MLICWKRWRMIIHTFVPGRFNYCVKIMNRPGLQLKNLPNMANEDDSPIVRLYLAAALQRLNHEARWDIAQELVRKSEDSDDHNIPKMIWFGSRTPRC